MEPRENREDIIGRQVGRYQVVSHLATGGMSELYIARQEAVGGFEKNLVLKLLQRRYAQHPRVVDMFLDEARLAAKLNHPNIVHVYDVGEESGDKFIAMEFIHGETLTDIIKRSVEIGAFLPVEHAVHIISQVAAGLDYAHRRHDAAGGLLRIVHRDVSPSNIMVSYEGQTKIIDFGIALVQDQIREESGMHPGKASYMSPEQVNGGAVDYRSDIFSLGIILYETTVARRLWRGSPDEVMKRIVNEAIAPPTTIRQDYPAALEAIVMKALEKRPEDRYQAAEELRHDLEEFIAAVGYRTGSRRVALLLREMFPVKAALSDEGIIQPRLAGDRDSAPLPLVGADVHQNQLYETAAGSGAAVVPALLPATTSTPAANPLTAPAYPPGMTRRPTASAMAAVMEPIAPRGPSNTKIAVAAALITVAAVTSAILLARSPRPPEGSVAVPAPPAEQTPPGEQARPGEQSPSSGPTEPAQAPAAVAAAGSPAAAAPAPSHEAVALDDTLKAPTRATSDSEALPRASTQSRGAQAASERLRNRRQRRQVAVTEAPARSSSPAVASPSPSPSPAPSAPEPQHAQPATEPGPVPSAAPPAPMAERSVPATSPALATSPAGPAPGYVDRKAVDAVARSHAAEVRACFDRAVMERADLHGRLAGRATVDPNGRVLSVAPTAVMDGGGRLQACVAGVIQTWVFPAPAGGVNGTVSYSFSFDE